MKKSKSFRINWRDILHGLYMAGLGSLLMSLTTVFQDLQQTGTLNLTLQDLYRVLGVACGAMGLYLVKVLTENSEGKVMKKELPKKYAE